MSATLNDQIITAVDRNDADLKQLSHFIHANPEIALEEVKSSAAAADFLEKRGFQVERGVAGLPTAFRATKGTGDAPRVAFLAEYDALPGVGHGCGHNLICMTAVGAGVGLGEVVSEIGGTVVVFGTPAEEAVGGKAIMADKGLFDGIDVAIGAHPSTVEAECPTVEGSGQALACQAVALEFFGQAAHAAADPHNGRNALDAVILTFNGINALRQHIKPDARLHGIVTKGGDAPNVIPDNAEALFYVRASTRSDMAELTEKVRQIGEGAALMTGCRLDFRFPEQANYDMIVNFPMAKRLKRHLDLLGVPLQAAEPKPGHGSTDWGNVSYVVPSVETNFPIMTGTCTWHSSQVVEAAGSEYAHQQGIAVAKALALTGLEALTDSELRAEAKAAFLAERDRREGR